jgi:hypothetical protein
MKFGLRDRTLIAINACEDELVQPGEPIMLSRDGSQTPHLATTMANGDLA